MYIGPIINQDEAKKKKNEIDTLTSDLHRRVKWSRSQNRDVVRVTPKEYALIMTGHRFMGELASIYGMPVEIGEKEF